SNCGETLTPTGPVITNAPNPLSCEGTRTYAYAYTDCEGNTATWSYVYTIERQPFMVPANGASTVACPAQTDVQPTPPVVTSNCGEVLTPVLTVSAKPLCEGTRTYTFTYTDCEGNIAVWNYTYTIEYNDFTVPASVVNNVECPVNATVPTPPTVTDNCGKVLTPVGPVVTAVKNTFGCEASRKYDYVYTDCEGNSHTWSVTYNFLYTADFFAPADEENYVTCLSYAVAPVPQMLTDFCGQPIKLSGPVVEESIAAGGCTGWRKFSYIYTDCGGHSHPWSFTYYINDNEGPLGTCQNNIGPVSINVTNLGCIEEVPCPDDYDFSQKIEELIENGNYYDVCSGDNISVTLEGSTDPWNCSDPDGNGIYTFGRTFYFRIADACGNEAASLCEVTYSGVCLPLESFEQEDWGITGGEPGSSVGEDTTDLQVIANLLANNPLVIGGNQRSLTVTNAQCIVDLLPSNGGPSRLGNCHQTNCSGSTGVNCNPMGIGGIKNSLAANAIALNLNMRYNVQYNGMTLNQVRAQNLGCLDISNNIVACTGNNCVLRIFDQAGVKYDFPYTVGGLLDLSNFFLGGNVSFKVGQTALYGKAINQSLAKANAYWSTSQLEELACDHSSLQPSSGEENAHATGGGSKEEGKLFSISPNPASREVIFRMTELAESQAVVLELYNSLGQLVLRKDFGSATYLNEQIDLTGVGDGIYMLSVKAGANHFAQILVISKG
ncbi:MAG: T9SS type A sorting domain-containing protein, partial [Saprospiraceae bacterium]|nr:T9SS type A sorting domain-containing protein [Saprospiraceae bacterium]